MIREIGLNIEDDTVTELKPSAYYRSEVVRPRLFTTLAMSFESFKLNGYTWYFNEKERSVVFSLEDTKEYEVNDRVIVAKNAKNNLILIDKDDNLHLVNKEGNIAQVIPTITIEEMLGLDRQKAPVDQVSIKVLGKFIPVGFILAYQVGLLRLIKSLGAKYRLVPKGSNLDMSINEYRLRFEDMSLILDRTDRVATLVLAGLTDYHKELTKYSIYLFDKKDVYLNLLEATSLSVRYIREIDLLVSMFVDHITKELLIEMNEPTNFNGLLVRACELLVLDDYPDEIDPAYMRIKGYEHIAGTIYNQLVQSVRAQSSRVGKKNAPIELNPFAVYRSIMDDPAVVVVNEINPIQELKEKEALTYSGTGGRSSRSMVKHTREFHKNDLGTVSESTIDSGDVGINVFLAPNAKFNSLRGLTSRFDSEVDGASSVISTSALLAPGVSEDDSKRQLFVSIQNGHTLACNGYRAPPVRTGMENVMSSRVSSTFATNAKQDGKVIELDEKHMTVEYKDGTTESIELGYLYGAASGLTVPHFIKPNVALNKTFKEGDGLAYNKGFFEPDRYNPNQLVYKTANLINVVLYETQMTDEDSCTLSARVTDELQTEVVKERNIVVSFSQHIRNLLKVGTNVSSTDVLCMIEDEVTANTDIFDKESLDTLKLLGSQTPLAKSKGVITDIEIFYHGDKEDMSDSLLKLANEGDKRRKEKAKLLRTTVVTGSVDGGYRIDGNPLPLDSLLVKVYITSQVSAAVGDKFVFANQMKTVCGKVMPNPIVAEDGTEIDAEFGRISIMNRIVNSTDILGTTITLLEVIGKKAAEIYNK